MARKLVVVNDNVRLVELGNIYGPISTPTRIPLESIRALCVKNRDVWECDPSDPRNREKRVKLTLANYGETHFGVSEKKGIENYSYTTGGVNKDAMDQYEPASDPVEEAPAEVVEPEAPVEEPVATEETTEDAAPAEEAVSEEAPVQEEVAKPQNPQNHNGKKNKKGR